MDQLLGGLLLPPELPSEGVEAPTLMIRRSRIALDNLARPKLCGPDSRILSIMNSRSHVFDQTN